MTIERMKRYISDCDRVLADCDAEAAQKLIEKIVLELGTDSYLRKITSQYLLKNSSESLVMLREIKKHLQSLIDNCVKTNQYDYVYVCHTDDDEYLAKELIELLLEIGLSEQQIMSSSVNNYTVPLGYDRYDFFDEMFNHNILVLFLLSNTTYNDHRCMQDMGAIWVLKRDYLSVICPDFNNRIKGAIDPRKVGIDLRNGGHKANGRLGQLKCKIEEAFHLSNISENRWEEKRDHFVESVKSYCELRKEKVIAYIKENAYITVDKLRKKGYSKEESLEIIDELTRLDLIAKDKGGKYKSKIKK